MSEMSVVFAAARKIIKEEFEGLGTPMPDDRLDMVMAFLENDLRKLDLYATTFPDMPSENMVVARTIASAYFISGFEDDKDLAENAGTLQNQLVKIFNKHYEVHTDEEK